jgi:hypothetical protein
MQYIIMSIMTEFSSRGILDANDLFKINLKNSIES